MACLTSKQSRLRRSLAGGVEAQKMEAGSRQRRVAAAWGNLAP